MIFSKDRRVLRRMYADAWQKRQDGKPMSPLETQIADIIEMHPEYCDEVAGDDIDTDYSAEGGKTNPFLHLGLHLGLREQIATNRPAGVAAIFSKLAERLGEPHEAEHRMIDCLAETLWDAQQNNQPPDEAQYVKRLRAIGVKHKA